MKPRRTYSSSRRGPQRGPQRPSVRPPTRRQKVARNKARASGSRDILPARQAPADARTSKKERPAAPVAREGFPMRLNKYLAHRGIATRRAADELIQQGRVQVNGKRAVVGLMVNESDDVAVKQGRTPTRFIYVLFNKPAGVDTHPERHSTKDALGMLPPALQRMGLFPVGRLDKESSGLMLFTNDGRVTERMLSPDRDHAKTYEVSTRENLRPALAQRMRDGVDIEGYTTKPAKVTVVNETRFRITLTEGKKHQIRRMMSAFGNEVKTLRRISIGNLLIDGIGEGKYRILEGADLSGFLSSLGLAESVY